jgi:hypothetical protein
MSILFINIISNIFVRNIGSEDKRKIAGNAFEFNPTMVYAEDRTKPDT